MQANYSKTLSKEIEEDVNKQRLITYFIRHGASSIADLAKEVNLSVPTVTKLLKTLTNLHYINPIEKSKGTGTWNAMLYDLNPELGYFLGVDLKHNQTIITLTDFQGGIIMTHTDDSYTYENTEASKEKFFQLIEGFITTMGESSTKLIAMGVSLSGRIDTNQGIDYNHFYKENYSIEEEMKTRFGIPVMIDNASRCMAYAEYISGAGKNMRNVIYVNVNWGLGISMIINHEIYYGKSGMSGEYGHLSVFNNEILCGCGKKGCLETEASGRAIHRKFIKEIQNGAGSIILDQVKNLEDITLDHILQAARREDELAIKIIMDTGHILGKFLAGLLNLFNPDMLVLGGTVGRLGDYLSVAIKSSMMQYSHSCVINDTQISSTKHLQIGSSLGVCLLTRSKWLKIIETKTTTPSEESLI